MIVKQPNCPIIDLHCDLTHYLATVPNATPDNTEGIGCAIPYLKQGNVKLQVMAISSVEKNPDVSLTLAQIAWYKKLLSEYGAAFRAIPDKAGWKTAMRSNGTTMVPAIENASALCAETDSLEKTFSMLDGIMSELGKPLYISLTHHGENRFGGGNTTNIGLKDDGRAVLEYISGKKIAVDFSHTSDVLAYDIIEHIDAKNLAVPIIASHSNFRAIHKHPRNLTDELAKIIIDRKGLIGMNFLRAFMHPDDPDYLRKHILYGLELGGQNSLALGADYFYTDNHPDPTRKPFYFEEHEHAGKYQSVLSTLSSDLDTAMLKKLAHENVLRFVRDLL